MRAATTSPRQGPRLRRERLEHRWSGRCRHGRGRVGRRHHLHHHERRPAGLADRRQARHQRQRRHRRRGRLPDNGHGPEPEPGELPGRRGAGHAGRDRARVRRHRGRGSGVHGLVLGRLHGSIALGQSKTVRSRTTTRLRHSRSSKRSSTTTAARPFRARGRSRLTGRPAFPASGPRSRAAPASTRARTTCPSPAPRATTPATGTAPARSGGRRHGRSRTG